VYCPYRHCEEARESGVVCEAYSQTRTCPRGLKCPNLHTIQQDCFYETTAGGCQRQDCIYRHRRPRNVDGAVNGKKEDENGKSDEAGKEAAPIPPVPMEINLPEEKLADKASPVKETPQTKVPEKASPVKETPQTKVPERTSPVKEGHTAKHVRLPSSRSDKSAERKGDKDTGHFRVRTFEEIMADKKKAREQPRQRTPDVERMRKRAANTEQTSPETPKRAKHSPTSTTSPTKPTSPTSPNRTDDPLSIPGPLEIGPLPDDSDLDFGSDAGVGEEELDENELAEFEKSLDELKRD